MKETAASRSIAFDPTPEIFATGGDGKFLFPLTEGGSEWIDTRTYDEMRLVLSIWHPSSRRAIDLDSAYVELQGRFDGNESHWTRVAEIEPIVPAYDAGRSFDGWIVLPILGERSSFRLAGAGLENRARLQLRASAYFVA